MFTCDTAAGTLKRAIDHTATDGLVFRHSSVAEDGVVPFGLTVWGVRFRVWNVGFLGFQLREIGVFGFGFGSAQALYALGAVPRVQGLRL